MAPSQPQPLSALGESLAGWWQRVGAMVLDVLLLIVPTIVVVAALGTLGRSPRVAAAEFLVSLLIGGAYFGGLNGTGSGQTLGNKAVRVAVRDAQAGSVLGWGRGLLRWFVRVALYVFVLPGVLSDLWPLWDDRRQSLADKVAGSVVIRLR